MQLGTNVAFACEKRKERIMPIYELHCQSCHRDFETMAGINQESIACPHCRSTETRRLISHTHFRHADHWVKDMMGAMHRSKERDQLKKEAQQSIG
jgi:putative FmdB family regulatory protein